MVHPPNRGEYTPTEVAEAIAARGGPKVSASYIWALLAGRRAKPSLEVLDALCGFFGVSPTYFFDSTVTADVEQELRLIAAMRDSGVEAIALRASALSPKSRDVVRQLIEALADMEGVAPPSDGVQPDPPQD